MKRILIALLCYTAIILGFVSCSSSNQDTDVSAGNDKPEYESYAAQIEYYIGLMQTMQEKLIEEKKESFIAECEYKLEIENLKKEILQLQNHENSVMTESDNAEDPTDTPNNHEEIQKQFDEASTKANFVCKAVGGKLTVTSYIGDQKEIVIPSEVAGAPLKAIGEGAFKDAVITKVVIPDGVQEIGWFAFSGCKALCEVYIPSSVTSVGYGAFDHCPSNLTIFCEEGSYIEAYARSWGIKTASK